MAVADAVEAAVLRGELHEGDWLPSWEKLGKQYGYGRSTGQLATSLLAQRGVVEIVPQRGARVVDRRIRRADRHQSEVQDGWRGFRPAAKEAGLEPWDETLHIGDVPAAAEVAQHLGIAAAAVVVERRRIHGVLSEGVRAPAYLSATWFHPEIAAELPVVRAANTGAGGVTQRFKDVGYRVRWEAIETVRPTTAGEAEQLDIPADWWCMDVWRRCFDQNDRVLEVTWMLVSPRWLVLAHRWRDED
jgi:GntR family transcriptional regulator